MMQTNKLCDGDLYQYWPRLYSVMYDSESSVNMWYTTCLFHIDLHAPDIILQRWTAVCLRAAVRQTRNSRQIQY